VAAYRDPDHALSVNRTVKESHSASRWTRGAPNRIPEQVSLNLDTPVPMLMDSVEDTEEKPSPAISSEREPSLGDLSDLDADPIVQESHQEAEVSAPAAAVEEVPRPREVEKAEKAERSEKVEPVENRAPDEVLIVNVMARKGEFFAGPDLLNAMLSQGLRYGDMDIFHRHESVDGRGRILFSAANIVVPGTFDLDTMDDFTTPGISLFLSLPIAGDSLSAYNLMVTSAQAIADALQGELKDEQRSVMTRQTIEHGRQRVIEYERKRRLAKS
jgi:cell division protein ZipA